MQESREMLDSERRTKGTLARARLYSLEVKIQTSSNPSTIDFILQITTYNIYMDGINLYTWILSNIHKRSKLIIHEVHRIVTMS